MPSRQECEWKNKFIFYDEKDWEPDVVAFKWEKDSTENLIILRYDFSKVVTRSWK